MRKKVKYSHTPTRPNSHTHPGGCAIALCCALLLLLWCGGLRAETKAEIVRDDAVRVQGSVRHVRVDDGTAAWDGEGWTREERHALTPWFADFTDDGKPREVITLHPNVREVYRYDAHAREIAYQQTVDALPMAGRVTTYHPQGALATREEWSQSPAGITRTAYSYDARGNEIAARFYNADGHLYSAELTSYTPDGSPAAEKVYNGAGKLLGSTRYTYDAQGHEVSRVVRSGGSVLDTVHTLYDAQGREIWRTDYRRPGAPMVFWQTSYPGRERLVEQRQTTDTHATRLLLRTRFDAEGRKVAETSYRYHGDGTRQSRLETHYDAQGHVVLEEQYLSSTIPYTRRTADYDAAGNLTREITATWGAPAHERQWSYQYDRRGNWIKRYQREWDNGKSRDPAPSCALTFRRIIYWGDPFALPQLLPDQLATHPELWPRLRWFSAGGMLGLCLLGWVIRRRRHRKTTMRR